MADEIKYGLNGVENFRLLNFATGSYRCTCSVCKKEFIGDKRAVMCLECAIKAVEKKLAPTNPGSPELPPVEEVLNEASHCGPKGIPSAEHFFSLGCRAAYDVIDRQLRAGGAEPYRKEGCQVDLRDYFAGQALTGMLSHPETELDKRDLVPYMYECYQIADAMLAARGAQPAEQGDCPMQPGNGAICPRCGTLCILVPSLGKEMYGCQKCEWYGKLRHC